MTRISTVRPRPVGTPGQPVLGLPVPRLPEVPDDMRPWSSREAYAHEMFDLEAE